MDKRPVVFIPSRGRWLGAKKLTDAWHSEGFDVNWMVEPTEHDKYFDVLHKVKAPDASQPATFIAVLPKENQGIAYSRKQCLEMADQIGYDSIALADDDIRPSRKGGNMRGLVEMAKHPKVMGITARYSYHDLALGEDFRDFQENKVILNPSGTFRLLGLNVNNVLSIGNYDDELEYAEDCDLFMRSLQAGFPWMIHAGTFSNSIGTRYQPGGMLDYADSTANSLPMLKGHWHEVIHDKWPAFTNEHKPSVCKGKQNCIRFQWKRAYDHFLPKWREWSELDGGDLQEYIRGDI